MFGIRDAEMIREVVRAGGFRAAAEALGLSQSAVSNRIAALESRLGVRLFDRSRRRVSLTLVGRRFLEESERLVALRDQIAESIAGEADVPGTLRLGVAETIVHTRLPAILKALRDAAPRLRIELSVEVSGTLAAMLASDALDAAVLLSEFAPGGAVGRSVGRYPLGWYAAPSLALGEAPLDAAALAGWPIVTFSRGTTPYREVERLFARPDIPAPLLHGSASLATVLALVADGVGVGTLPVEMAADAVARGAIVEVGVVADLRPTPLEFTFCRTKELGPFFAEAMARLNA